MSEFIKKGNKYYRNNSDGTQTHVTPTQDGYFTWTQPDGKKVRSQKRYKISTTSQKKERKPSLWDSFKTALRNFGAYSATSEPGGSAIQTSEGTQINNDGSFTYNKPTEGSEQLRKIIGMIGLSGLAGYGGGAALSYIPAIVPEITIGQLPWWQTTIGSTAGSIVTGMTADKISKRITGKTIGGNVKSGVASFGPAGQMYANIIPEGVWDMINPFYSINPVSAVNKTAQIIHNATNYRPFLPYNPNRYYRIVGLEDAINGDAILDANVTGVIRSKATGKGISFTTPDGKVHSIGKMGFDYPMFSRGRVWKGSTNGAGEKYRVIRSKADTGPIKWEQSNVDFRHKGHAGIYRPSFYGHQNIAPVEYFEYWEPAKFFGWNRREFTPFQQSKNLGRIEYNPQTFTSQVKGLGSEIGMGDEALVLANDDRIVYKVLENPGALPGKGITEWTPENIKSFYNDYIASRNKHLMFEPITFEGLVQDSRGMYLPVISQKRLIPSANGAVTEQDGQALLKSIDDMFINNGYNVKATPYGTPGYIKEGEYVYDVHPWNVGTDGNGNLKVFDMLTGYPN